MRVRSVEFSTDTVEDVTEVRCGVKCIYYFNSVKLYILFLFIINKRLNGQSNRSVCVKNNVCLSLQNNTVRAGNDKMLIIFKNVAHDRSYFRIFWN